VRSRSSVSIREARRPTTRETARDTRRVSLPARVARPCCTAVQETRDEAVSARLIARSTRSRGLRGPLLPTFVGNVSSDPRPNALCSLPTRIGLAIKPRSRSRALRDHSSRRFVSISSEATCRLTRRRPDRRLEKLGCTYATESRDARAMRGEKERGPKEDRSGRLVHEDASMREIKTKNPPSLPTLSRPERASRSWPGLAAIGASMGALSKRRSCASISPCSTIDRSRLDPRVASTPRETKREVP